MMPNMNPHVSSKGRLFTELASSIVYAALALCAGACGTDDTFPVAEGGRASVEVSMEDSSCETHDDCSLVYSNCLGCDRVAISGSAVSQHRSEWQELCSDFLGPYGECDARAVVARCEKSVCAVKASADVDTSVTTPHEVEVRSVYMSCESDADCSSVDTGCNGCCQRAAIAESFLDDFRAEITRLCSGFHDGQCDCEPISLVTVCREGVCVAE